MSSIITLEKEKKVFINTTDKSDGKYLRDLYMESQDNHKLDKYRKKAQEMLDELKIEIEENIKKGKPPIGEKNTSQTKSGIIAQNTETEDLFQDYLFTTILADVAEEQDLKIDMQMRPMGIDSKTRQPVMAIVLICTFR